MAAKHPPSSITLTHGFGFYHRWGIKSVFLVKKCFAFSSIVFALIALELGGSMMLGTCAQAYSIGLYGLLYVVGITIGFLLLGFGFAAKMKAMNVESTIDLFELKYRSPFIRICAFILSILTTGGLLIGQIIAAKSLVHSIGIHSEWIFILLSLCIIVYAVVGGLKAAGITYGVQLIYTVVIFGGIFAFCMFHESPTFLSELLVVQNQFDPSNVSFALIFGSLVMPALYYLTDQEYAKPLFTSSNAKEAAASAISASIFMLVFSCMPIYFGLKAKMLNLSVPDDMNPLLPILQLLTNDLVAWLAVLGIAAALIAMIDYYLWSVSLNVTAELSIQYPRISTNALFSKGMVIAVGIIATLGSYCTTSNAIQVLLYSYELYDSCLIVPLIMSYFQSDLKKGAAIGSFASGLASFILFRFITCPIPCQIASLLLSLLGFYVGKWIEMGYKRVLSLKRSWNWSV